MNRQAILRARITGHVGRMIVDVDFDTAEGTLVVIGPNGAGKTSLLSFLLGARPVGQGRVAVGETVLLDTAAGIDVPIEHRGIGYVPQDYALFPHLNVRENIEFAVSCACSAVSPGLSRADRTERVDRIVSELGIEPYAARYPQTLSGGEKQLVALARALSVRPRALLLDEPLAALDVYARHEVRSLLAHTLQKLDIPALVVTHDVADARALGHRIAVLEDGRIKQMGTWEDLIERPATPFVEALVARDCIQRL